jgi:hypothetical protein
MSEPPLRALVMALRTVVAARRALVLALRTVVAARRALVLALRTVVAARRALVVGRSALTAEPGRMMAPWRTVVAALRTLVVALCTRAESQAQDMARLGRVAIRWFFRRLPGLVQQPTPVLPLERLPDPGDDVEGTDCTWRPPVGHPHAVRARHH